MYRIYIYILYIYICLVFPGTNKYITLQAVTRTIIMDAGRELTALTSADGFSACCAYLTTDLCCDGGYNERKSCDATTGENAKLCLLFRRLEDQIVSNPKKKVSQ